MLRLNPLIEKYDMFWFQTMLPKDMVNLINRELYDTIGISQNTMNYGIAGGQLNTKLRESKIQFFPATTWVGGLCYYYVALANNQCFQYDIDFFQDHTIQFTSYEEGEFYSWHVDADKPDPEGKIRKLSFTMQLSDPSEYEGGEFQIMCSSSNELLVAPKELGSITIFDSSLKHRVRKVKKGVRKSLVGWVVGPRFV
jgi:PKHD-type hydroxylase